MVSVVVVRGGGREGDGEGGRAGGEGEEKGGGGEAERLKEVLAPKLVAGEDEDL